MSEDSLNLYAKIEPMIGFYEEYERLYEIYLEILKNYHPKKVLDVGCGNGSFLQKLRLLYDAKGIDLSSQMVRRAKAKGVDARVCGINEVDEKFDAIVAVGDVLNYIKEEELSLFFGDVKKTLVKDGVFICDINTLYGFEEVTAGSLNIDERDRFLGIDAVFEDGVLRTDITLFEKNGECYKKERATVYQYYHDSKLTQMLAPFQLIKKFDISLFGERDDKSVLIFLNR